MSEDLKQRLPIRDRISLVGLGYGEGSVAHVIINPTRRWREAFVAATLLPPEEEETAVAYERRKAQALAPIVPHVVERVLLLHEGEEHAFELGDAAAVLALEETDPRVLDLAIGEAYERGLAGVLDARRTFRAGRAKPSERTG